MQAGETMDWRDHGLAHLAACPPEEALSSSKARRLRRFGCAFRAGAACVLKGPPGLPILSSSILGDNVAAHSIDQSGARLGIDTEAKGGMGHSNVSRWSSLQPAGSSSLFSRCSDPNAPFSPSVDANGCEEFLAENVVSGGFAIAVDSALVSVGGVSSASCGGDLANSVKQNCGGGANAVNSGLLLKSVPECASVSFAPQSGGGGAYAVNSGLLVKSVPEFACVDSAPVSVEEASLAPSDGGSANAATASCGGPAACIQQQSEVGHAASLHQHEQRPTIASLDLPVLGPECANPLDAVYEIVAGLCCPGLSIGDVVELTNLVRAASLNGHRGRVVTISASAERFGVELAAADTAGRAICKSVKATNLRVCKDTWADIADVVESAAHLTLTEEDVHDAIDAWEIFRVQERNSSRSKVRFVVPFNHSFTLN